MDEAIVEAIKWLLKRARDRAVHSGDANRADELLQAIERETTPPVAGRTPTYPPGARGGPEAGK